jgi:hypothetical protein
MALEMPLPLAKKSREWSVRWMVCALAWRLTRGSPNPLTWGDALQKLVVDAGAKCPVMARLKEHVRWLQVE